MVSRRASNGRSPLVRKQSQITALFSSSPTPSPSPSGPSPSASKPSPLPLNRSARTRSPLAAVSPSPPMQPQPQQKQKKGKKDKEERDVVAAVPAPLAAEVVRRRLRVYWPLDDTWYKGRVEAYDAASRRHRVKYDDGDEEVNLEKEWAAAVEDDLTNFGTNPTA